MKEILAEKLTTWHVSSDGHAVHLRLVDGTGQQFALVLPAELVSSLLMTLPGLAASALRARYRDPSLRVVYPLERFRLESRAGTNSYILTMATPDGFEVSFNVTRRTAGALQRAMDADAEGVAQAQLQ